MVYFSNIRYGNCLLISEKKKKKKNYNIKKKKKKKKKKRYKTNILHLILRKIHFMKRLPAKTWLKMLKTT